MRTSRATRVALCIWVYEYAAFKLFDDYSITAIVKKVTDVLMPWLFSAGAFVADVSALIFRTLRSITRDFVVDQFILFVRFTGSVSRLTVGLLFEFIIGYTVTVRSFYNDYQTSVNVTSLVLFCVIVGLVAKRFRWLERLQTSARDAKHRLDLALARPPPYAPQPEDENKEGMMKVGVRPNACVPDIDKEEDDDNDKE